MGMFIVGMLPLATPKAEAANLAPGCYTLDVNGSPPSITSVTCPSGVDSAFERAMCWEVRGASSLIIMPCNEAQLPGEVCIDDDGDARTGQTIPPGENYSWCDNQTQSTSTMTAQQACENGGYTWNTASGECEGRESFEGDCTDSNINADNCGIVHYLVIIINILSGVATIAIVISIAVGGIQYSMAGSDPQKVSAAKNRIRNAIIALLLFLFGYALLNFLIPGRLL